MKGDLMSKNSNSDGKCKRKIGISHSQFDCKIAREIGNYCENNSSENFEVVFDEHPLGQNGEVISKSLCDTINGSMDCLLILFSEKSMNEYWLNRYAQALQGLGMPKKRIGVIPVNLYVDDCDLPEDISKIQRFKFDSDMGSTGGLMLALCLDVKQEIEHKGEEYNF
jgi:hypothetical protein